MFKHYRTVLASLIIIAIISISGCSGPNKYADMVIHGGTIYTVDDDNSAAEAVAVKDGRIMAVGTMADIKPLIGDSTEILDVNGATVFPGLIEGHGHFIGMGYSKMQLDLMNIENFDELVAMVAAAVKESEAGEWILGRGWHQSKWIPAASPSVKGFPVHDALSAVSPDNPVYLRHASGHATFANAKAMEIAGVTADTPQPKGGEIIKDADGNPIGVFTERASGLVGRHVPDSTPARNKRALKLAVETALENGITSFHDAGIGNNTVERYKEAIRDGEMKIRIYAMLRLGDDALEGWYKRGPIIGYGDDHLTVRSIKISSDGALGSRGAWLVDDYTDRPGHKGHETTPMSRIRKVAVDALNNGFQLCVHAIGDRANREVLDQFEAAMNETGIKEDHRFRIEHAQHLQLDDIPRFAELGVIPAMQGIHMASDMNWAIDRLGTKRIEDGAYVWQKLLQSGVPIVNGTDVPVEPISPIASFYASVARRTLKGNQEAWFYPEQAMSRVEALRSYTLDAAYGAFEEDIKGSIKVGKLADFTILDRDILTVPEGDILATKVVHTIIGGKVVYSGK